MASVKKYYGLILLVAALLVYGGYQLSQNKQFNDRMVDPKAGDIYVFQHSNTYTPYLLDFIATDSLYFFAHPFDFSKNLPSHAQILEDSFQLNIHYIYGRTEVNRLLQEDVIVKIYR